MEKTGKTGNMGKLALHAVIGLAEVSLLSLLLLPAPDSGDHPREGPGFLVLMGVSLFAFNSLVLKYVFKNYYWSPGRGAGITLGFAVWTWIFWEVVV